MSTPILKCDFCAKPAVIMGTDNNITKKACKEHKNLI